MKNCALAYEDLIAAGASTEDARGVLPLNILIEYRGQVGLEDLDRNC